MSLYEQSVPAYIRHLEQFRGILEKASKYADENKKDHDEMLKYRLISDMQGITYQVQSCCNTSVWFVDRVGKLEHVAVEDSETTFQQLQDRLTRTIDYLKKVDPKAINDNADKEVLMETKMGTFKFDTAQKYFTDFAITNFHFHFSSGYCILREQGVPIGAMDYLGNVFTKV